MEWYLRVVQHPGWHGVPDAPMGWHPVWMASQGRWCPEWDGTSRGLGMLGGMASWYGIFGLMAPQVG